MAAEVYNKKTLFVVALIVIFTIFNYNYNKDVLEPKTKTSLGSKDPLQPVFDKSKKTLNSSSLKINNKSLIDKYTYEQRVNIKSRCHEYFYLIENGINAEGFYTEKYKKLHDNKEPTDKQIKAFKNFTEK